MLSRAKPPPLTPVIRADGRQTGPTHKETGRGGGWRALQGEGGSRQRSHKHHFMADPPAGWGGPGARPPAATPDSRVKLEFMRPAHANRTLVSIRCRWAGFSARVWCTRGVCLSVSVALCVPLPACACICVGGQETDRRQRPTPVKGHVWPGLLYLCSMA